MSPEVVGVLSQYGLPGVMLIAAGFAMRVLWTRSEQYTTEQRERAERAEARAERAEQAIRDLTSATQEKAFVVLAEATAAIRDLLAERRSTR